MGAPISRLPWNVKRGTAINGRPAAVARRVKSQLGLSTICFVPSRSRRLPPVPTFAAVARWTDGEQPSELCQV
jgi:hypothetical protein